LKREFKFYRLNYQIPAARIRLLDEKGAQIGIVDKIEALKRAQSEGKDLVEIAAKANPPVVKLIDFKKFKYLEAKKLKESKKKIKHVGIKEIRLSPFIKDHDFNNRMNQGESFLKAGNQLKISIFFRGREISHKEFGYQVINKAIDHLCKVARVVKPPFFEGRTLITIMSLTKPQKKSDHAEIKN